MAEGERPPHDPTHVPPNFRWGLRCRGPSPSSSGTSACWPSWARRSSFPSCSTGLDLAERAWKRDVSRGTVLATFAVFVAVCAAVTYHDLRRVKDGVGIEDLLEVFE